MTNLFTNLSKNVLCTVNGPRMDRHNIENGPIHSRQLFAVLVMMLWVKLVNFAKLVMQICAESAESAKSIFATFATFASANFVGKASCESTVRYRERSRISLIKPLLNPYLTLTRFRYSLDSNLSRFSLASLICLCMMTVGVGQMWATKVTSTFTNKSMGVGTGEPTWSSSTTPTAFEDTRGVSWSKASTTLTNTSLSSYSISQVDVVTSANGSGGTITVTVGGNSFSSTSASISSGEANVSHTFTGSATTGNIQIGLPTGGKSIWVKSISVTYSDGCASTLSTPIVTATPTSGQVVLTWPDVANATKYQLKWNGGSWTDAVSGVTKTSLTNGTEYTYQVKAIGNGSTICDSDPTESAKVIPGTYYTVTWKLNGSTYETTSVRSGTKPTFPDNPTSCDGISTTFMGWTQTDWSGKIDDISGKTTTATKIYAKASDMPDISAAITYYAVFAKQDGGSPTSVTSYSAGSYYLVAKYSSDYYAMSGSTTSGITAVKVTSGVTYNSTPKTITVNPSSFTSNMVYAISGTTSAATITQAGTVVGNSDKGDFNRTGTWVISDISSAKTFRFSGNSRCIMYRNTPIFKNYATSNAGGTGYGDGYLYLVPAPTYSKYLTSCCTPLASINGSFFWTPLFEPLSLDYS